MPSSVSDRFTVDFEYLFFFSKNKKYYFETQYEPLKVPDRPVGDRIGGNKYFGVNKNNDMRYKKNELGRNKRTVWNIDSKYEDCEQEATVRQGMHKDRGNGLVEKRDLPNQKEFVDKLRENFTAEQIMEKTGLPLTKVEHWFRYDESGFSYPSKDDWEKLGTDLFPELKEVWYENDDISARPEGRIKRTTWSINTKPFKEAHFATYPEELCYTPIKAGCPIGGIVLDPFFGAGTTGLVALKQNKNFIGIELNPKYIDIIKNRLRPYLEQKRLKAMEGK